MNNRDPRRARSPSPGRAEVHLDRSHLVWLTMGSLVAVGMTFAIGVLVGRRAERLEHALEASADRTQLTPPKPAEPALTFYDKLTEDRPGELTPPPRPPIQPANPPNIAAPDATTPRAATAGSAAPSPHADAAVIPAQDELAAALARLRAGGSDIVGDEVLASLRAGPAGPGEYTVQVSAFPSKAEAEAYAANLNRKGYRPFVVEGAPSGKGTWYRVRMGRFSDPSTAATAKGLLAQADIPGWVLRSE